MKKLILPLLLLVGITMLVAVESAPSAVVGYFKLSLADGAVSTISLPLVPKTPVTGSNLAIQNAIGNQFSDLDTFTDANSGLSAEMDLGGGGWYGDLENLEYGGAYYVSRYAGNGPVNFFLMGKVDPQPLSIAIGGGAVTTFGLNEARTIPLTPALFGTNETELDVITDADTGLGAEYDPGLGNWYGDLVDVGGLEPTHAYYYSCVGTGFTWNYVPAPPTTRNVVSNTNSK